MIRKLNESDRVDYSDVEDFLIDLEYLIPLIEQLSKIKQRDYELYKEFLAKDIIGSRKKAFLRNVDNALEEKGYPSFYQLEKYAVGKMKSVSELRDSIKEITEYQNAYNEAFEDELENW